MKIVGFQATERVKLTWWQRVVVALLFVLMAYIVSVAARLLSDHTTFAFAVHADLRVQAFVTWFIGGAIASSYIVRRRVKP